jgi:hypothetical protein
MLLRGKPMYCFAALPQLCHRLSPPTHRLQLFPEVIISISAVVASCWLQHQASWACWVPRAGSRGSGFNRFLLMLPNTLFKRTCTSTATPCSPGRTPQVWRHEFRVSFMTPLSEKPAPLVLHCLFVCFLKSCNAWVCELPGWPQPNAWVPTVGLFRLICWPIPS